jgi:regulator of protease activity HflC (stomatin/prohibitin superfamily)
MDQIVKDLARYREKGVSDSIAVREHDSRFESFMRGTMTFKHEQMEKRLIAQRAVRASLKRAQAQRERKRAADTFVPPVRPISKPKPAPGDERAQKDAELQRAIDEARAASRLKKQQQAQEQANVA